jgi:two-component system sensor histidine kinase VicK
VFYNTPIRKEFIKFKGRGIRLRFITEIIKDTFYCKELLKIIDLRHLESIKENFGISHGKNYGDSASTKEEIL